VSTTSIFLTHSAPAAAAEAIYPEQQQPYTPEQQQPYTPEQQQQQQQQQQQYR